MILIKNLIFDFGGVIYDIDFESARKSFVEIGINNFEEIYSQAVQSKLFEMFECDLISVEDFRNEIRILSDKNVSARELDLAWNSLLVGFKPDRISLLEKAKDRYQIFLLSNSNRIHYDYYIMEFQELTNYNSFDELFIRSFFSFNIKLRKPDINVYKHL
ncbi:MAG: HAD family phosphatase, partial [Bacteroidetes bacterium]|nr:HAD family phosphatase [Bacteroidota bacterium]